MEKMILLYSGERKFLSHTFGVTEEQIRIPENEINKIQLSPPWEFKDKILDISIDEDAPHKKNVLEFIIGKLNHYGNQWAIALNLFQNSLNQAPPEAAPLILYRMASTFEEMCSYTSCFLLLNDIKRMIGEKRDSDSVFALTMANLLLGKIYRYLYLEDLALETLEGIIGFEERLIRENYITEKGLAGIYEQIGIIYRNRNDGEMFGRYLDMALEKANPNEKFNIHYQYGRLFIDKGLPGEAEKHLREIEKDDVMRSRRASGYVHNLKGMIFRALGKFEEAAAAYNKSILEFKRIAYLRGVMNVNVNYARLLDDAGDWDGAVRCLEEAATHAIYNQSPVDLAYCHIRMADIYFEMMMKKEFKDHYDAYQRILMNEDEVPQKGGEVPRKEEGDPMNVYRWYHDVIGIEFNEKMLPDRIKDRRRELEAKIAKRENLKSGIEVKLGRELKSITLLTEKTLMDIENPLLEALRSDNINVLVTGETGSGKNELVKFIVENSSRRDGEFLSLDCSLFDEDTIRDKLFGHVKGAFAGANSNKDGYLEQVKGGTLFLDEIGGLSMDLQTKILNVLERKRYSRLGEWSREEETDFRLICATSTDLLQEIASSRFRQDLYARIRGVSIHLAPLRRRVNDLETYVNSILPSVAREENKSGAEKYELDAPLMESLKKMDFLIGNIRDLKNILHRMVIASGGRTIRLKDVDYILQDFEEENRQLKMFRANLKDGTGGDDDGVDLSGVLERKGIGGYRVIDKNRFLELCARFKAELRSQVRVAKKFGLQSPLTLVSLLKSCNRKWGKI